VNTMHHVGIPYLPQEHKPAQPLGRLIHPPTKLNNKQWTVIKHGQWRGWVKMLNLPQRKGKGQGAKPSAKLSVKEHRKCSEDWEQVGEKTLPEAGQVVDHRDDLVSQQAPSKTKLHCKTTYWPTFYNNFTQSQLPTQQAPYTTTTVIYPNTHKSHKTQQLLHHFPHSPTPLPGSPFSATLTNSPNFYS
jgi:hypothetical protein